MLRQQAASRIDILPRFDNLNIYNFMLGKYTDQLFPVAARFTVSVVGRNVIYFCLRLTSNFLPRQRFH